MSFGYRKDSQLKNHLQKTEENLQLAILWHCLAINTCSVPAYSQEKEVFGRNFCCAVLLFFFLPEVELLPVWSRYVIYNQIVSAGGSACTAALVPCSYLGELEDERFPEKKRACILYTFFCIQCDADNRQSWNQDVGKHTESANYWEGQDHHSVINGTANIAGWHRREQLSHLGNGMWQGAGLHNTCTWNTLRSSIQTNVKGFELSSCWQFDTIATYCFDIIISQEKQRNVFQRTSLLLSLSCYNSANILCCPRTDLLPTRHL